MIDDPTLDDLYGDTGVDPLNDLELTGDIDPSYYRAFALNSSAPDMPSGIDSLGTLDFPDTSELNKATLSSAKKPTTPEYKAAPGAQLKPSSEMEDAYYNFLDQASTPSRQMLPTPFSPEVTSDYLTYLKGITTGSGTGTSDYNNYLQNLLQHLPTAPAYSSSSSSSSSGGSGSSSSSGGGGNTFNIQSGSGITGSPGGMGSSASGGGGRSTSGSSSSTQSGGGTGTTTQPSGGTTPGPVQPTGTGSQVVGTLNPVTGDQPVDPASVQFNIDYSEMRDSFGQPVKPVKTSTGEVGLPTAIPGVYVDVDGNFFSTANSAPASAYDIYGYHPADWSSTTGVAKQGGAPQLSDYKTETEWEAATRDFYKNWTGSYLTIPEHMENKTSFLQDIANSKLGINEIYKRLGADPSLTDWLGVIGREVARDPLNPLHWFATVGKAAIAAISGPVEGRPTLIESKYIRPDEKTGQLTDSQIDAIIAAQKAINSGQLNGRISSGSVVDPDNPGVTYGETPNEWNYAVDPETGEAIRTDDGYRVKIDDNGNQLKDENGQPVLLDDYGHVVPRGYDGLPAYLPNGNVNWDAIYVSSGTYGGTGGLTFDSNDIQVGPSENTAGNWYDQIISGNASISDVPDQYRGTVYGYQLFDDPTFDINTIPQKYRAQAEDIFNQTIASMSDDELEAWLTGQIDTWNSKNGSIDYDQLLADALAGTGSGTDYELEEVLVTALRDAGIDPVEYHTNMRTYDDNGNMLAAWNDPASPFYMDWNDFIDPMGYITHGEFAASGGNVSKEPGESFERKYAYGGEIDPYAGGGDVNPFSNTYAAGGTLLRGPGDGMSDSIPAVINGEEPQRAALADGEFVIPADVVSHLGNGSTEAGSRTLYDMMDRVRMARTGRKQQAPEIDPNDFLPE